MSPHKSAHLAETKPHSPDQKDGKYLDEDEDWMDIDGDNPVDQRAKHNHIAKRMRIGSTNEQHDVPLAIATAFSNEFDATLHHGTERKPSKFSPPPNQHTKFSIHDAENTISEVSPKAHKGQQAGLLFSQITMANLPEAIKGLDEIYSFSALRFGARSKFDQNVQVVVSLLSQNSFSATPMKPTVVVLIAQIEQSARMLAVGEEVKARIAANGDHWFQYTEMQNELVTLKPKTEKHSVTGKILREWDEEQKSQARKATVEIGAASKGHVHAVDDAEETFETMVHGRSAEMPARLDSEKEKVRAMPVLRVYLTRTQISELCSVYGLVPPQLRLVTRW